MAGNGDNETTDDLIEGTRQARDAAREAMEEAHEDAASLEEQLEDEGKTASPEDE